VPLCLLLLEALAGDAERGEPRIEEVGIAVAVLLEGCCRAVELEGGQLVGRDEPEDLGLVEGPGELPGVQDVGEVDERTGRGGYADPVVAGGVGVAEAVEVDGGMSALARRGDVGRRRPARDDPPQRRSGLVAQCGVGAAGEDRRHRRGER
jgi:hypothetical protein